MLTDQQQTTLVHQTEMPQVKILLVDDLEENLVSLESLLSNENEKHIEYLFANSGEEALKIALQEELALILLDVQMPGMNGYEVARYLRDISKTRNIPIIFVTAINEQEVHVVEGFEAGAVDFLFKPLHPYITKSKVSQFVKFYVQRKELERVNEATSKLNLQLEDKVQERTKELTRVNKDLDNFVYTASHDLKAPINNIEGLITALHENLQENSTDLENVAPIFNMITEAIGRFKQTLIDLTEIAKLNHEQTIAQEEVYFEEILDEVKFNIQDMILKYDATIVHDFSEVPSVVFSRKNLRSILYNLISNSIKYSSPDRKPLIQVKTAKAGDCYLLTVEDNGLGIGAKNHEKVFDMFSRMHSHVEGTGVGLAIVKRIVEICDGKIEFSSEVGKGTVFKVHIK